jgi:hypothetical protein
MWPAECFLEQRREEKQKMKKKLLALVLLAGSSAFAAPRFSIGVGIGAPVVATRPPCPGPGYNWVDGYYNPYGSWVNGYWAAPVAQFGFSSGFYGSGVRRDFDRDRHRDFDRDDRGRNFGQPRTFQPRHDNDHGREAGFNFRR